MRKIAILLLTLAATLAAALPALSQGKYHGSYNLEQGIPYHAGAGEYAAERCVLDFYYPAELKDFPTVVWFHGGGLTGGQKDIPEGLKDSGIGIIGVNYRLLPKATVQECIDDAAAAVAWAFREVASRGGSPEKIFVAGHSAGGYLTDMIVLDKKWLAAYGIDSDKIAGAFPYSAQKITHFNVREKMGMGPLQPLVDETAPLFHVRKLPMPMLVLSGDRELELYGRYEEQAYFWRMMRLSGNEDIFLYEFDGYDHGGMAVPAHNVVKRFIRAISAGEKLPAR
ncbi:MAG: alpha/beta hydrolase [Bacteroidales bacterium]|nr:alpha/beta hydrolase [Bacteroidales bacterium]